MSSIFRFGVSVALSVLLWSCGPSSGAEDTGVLCDFGETRCEGEGFQICMSGTFHKDVTCAGATTCSAQLGCVECSPENGPWCDGDMARTCAPDGSLSTAEQCEAGTCSNGYCIGDGSQAEEGCRADGNDLIYVVDIDNNFLRFDPRKSTDQFELVGKLNCPGANGTPFSMSVDRDGTAWVLFNKGQIFKVSIEDASCVASGWGQNTDGFNTFGMGFVSDGPGLDSETLHIAGPKGLTGKIRLGTIGLDTMTATTLGNISGRNPELTGTGDGLLYGYFPDESKATVSLLHKTTGAKEMTWSTNTVSDVRAWAFAHWGGEFYIFVTSGTVNYVFHLDPVSGMTDTLFSSSPYTVVGAGVSTCAPTVIE